MAHTHKKTAGFWANVREIAGLLLIVFIIRTIGFGLYQVPTGSMETTMLVGERFFADKFTYLFWNPQRNDILALNDPTYQYSENWFMRLFEEYVWGPSNWTKRVIGMPGDHIKGVIEHGKPVVYRNGEKLDESSYINKYPLVREWRVDIREVEKLVRQGASEEQLGELLVPKTYDPSKPFNQQEFYNLNPERLLRNNGQIYMVYPGTPLPESAEYQDLSNDKNYWTGSDVFNVHLGNDEYWLMGDNREGSKDSRFFGPIKRRLIHGRILWRIWSIDSDESWWIVDLIKHPIAFWGKVRWHRFFQRVV